MKQVIEFKPDYKDDILKFASNGIILAKHPSFNLNNEIGIFVGSNKILKSDYKFFISIDGNRVPTGAICLDKDGEVLLFAVEQKNFQDAVYRLLGKCDELLTSKKYPKISGRTNPKYILEFNDRGYKTLKFFEGETSEFKFLVQKRKCDLCPNEVKK